MNTEKNIKNLYEYLGDSINLGDEEIKSIKFALHLIKEMPPTDGPQVFSRQHTLITASEDLSWVISVINRGISKISANIKDIKAVEFTMLTRNGRPSATAIEFEIYMIHPELKDLEEKLSTLENTIIFLEHIETSLDRLIWLLRDKLKYNN